MIFYILFAIGLIAFAYFYHKYAGQEDSASLKKVYASSAFCIVFLVIIGYQFFFVKSIKDKNLLMLEYSSEKVGKYLASNTNKGVALIITDMNTGPETVRGKALIEGLKKGFGLKIKIKSIEVLGISDSIVDDHPNNPRKRFRPPTYQDYDKILKRYPLCNVVIFLSGLPPGFTEMDFWFLPKIPKTAIFSIAAERMKEAVRMGFVTAAISYNYKAIKKLQNQSATPKNLDACFTLVTKQ